MLPITEIKVNDNLKILVDDDFAIKLKDLLSKKIENIY